MSRPTVYVCTGGDCRKAKRHAELVAAVAAVADVRTVGCQKVCDGPVAGTKVDGRVEWFAHVRRRGRQALTGWLCDRDERSPLPLELRDRRVAKRSGRVR